MSKPTLATLKSFVKKNSDQLFLKMMGSFDGMIDGIYYEKNPPFIHTLPGSAGFSENTLGFSGIWLVGGSRDHISTFQTKSFIGYEVYNSCGSFVVAIEVKESVDHTSRQQMDLREKLEKDFSLR